MLQAEGAMAQDLRSFAGRVRVAWTGEASVGLLTFNEFGVAGFGLVIGAVMEGSIGAEAFFGNVRAALAVPVSTQNCPRHREHLFCTSQTIHTAASKIGGFMRSRTTHPMRPTPQRVFTEFSPAVRPAFLLMLTLVPVLTVACSATPNESQPATDTGAHASADAAGTVDSEDAAQDSNAAADIAVSVDSEAAADVSPQSDAAAKDVSTDAASTTGCVPHPSCAKPCGARGACTLVGDKCEVTTDCCAASQLCQGRGKCALSKGKCAPTSHAHCKASADCAKDGKCGLKEDACAVTDQGCKNSTKCSDIGACTAHGAVCTPSSDAECKASAGCAASGNCFAFNGLCQKTKPTDATCEKQKACSLYGKCSLKDGHCALIDAEDCHKTNGCIASGRCALFLTGPQACPNELTASCACSAASDADCEGSTNCKKWAKCTKSGTYSSPCHATSDADCAKSELCTLQGKCTFTSVGLIHCK